MASTKDVYEQEFRGTDAGLGSAIDGIVKKMGNFAESENKVKRHLGGFVQDLSRATSATGVLSSAIFRMGEAMKLGILGGVVASTMVNIKENSDAVTKSFDELRSSMTDLEKSGNVSQVAKPLEALRSESQKAQEAQKKLQEQIRSFEDDDVWSGMVANRHFWGAAGGKLLETMTLGGVKNQYEGVNEQMHNDLARMEKMQEDAEREIIRREGATREENALRLQSATGPQDPYETTRIGEKMLALSKEELRLAERAVPINEDDIAKKRIAVALQQQKVEEAKAELRVLDLRRERLDEEMFKARTGPESATEREYELLKLNAELMQAEADAMKVKNVEQGRFLQLKANEAKLAPAMMDEKLNKGKSSKEVRDRIRDQEKEQRETEKFRARREEAGGLIPTKRNMDGEVIEGIDPVTGKKVKREVDRFGEQLAKAKERAKQDGKGVDDFIGPKQPEEEKAKAAEREAAKKDAKEGNKEVVQEIKGLRQDVKDLVNKR